MHLGNKMGSIVEGKERGWLPSALRMLNLIRLRVMEGKERGWLPSAIQMVSLMEGKERGWLPSAPKWFHA